MYRACERCSYLLPHKGIDAWSFLVGTVHATISRDRLVLHRSARLLFVVPAKVRACIHEADCLQQTDSLGRRRRSRLIVYTKLLPLSPNTLVAVERGRVGSRNLFGQLSFADCDGAGRL